MKTLKAREPEVGQINGVDRPVGPISPVPKLKQPGRSRRPLMLALMVLTIVMGALAAYWLIQRSSDRVSVVGMAHDVAWGQQITASDVVAVSVVADPSLRPVGWAERDEVVGHRAASDLRAGSLITARSVTDDQIPAAGDALVGVLVKAGQMPVTSLAARDRVLLVQVAQPGVSVPAGSAAKPVEAQVYTAGPADANGARTVDVIVPVGVAAQVAAAAVAGRVVIVLVPRS